MNFRLNAGPRFPCVCSLWAGLALLMPGVGCALLGVEPDEIDVAMGSESEDDGETGVLGGSAGGSDTGQAEDGGDGDGDNNGTGDGDGDADEATDCTPFEPTPLVAGSVDATIPAGPSQLEAPDCGNPGPERIYTFSSDAAAVVQITLTADYEAVFYRVDGPSCQPAPDSCISAPDIPLFALDAGEVLYVALDAATADGGSGTLDVVIGP
jgi:hypothetical protein